MSLAALLLSGCATTQGAGSCPEASNACFGREELDDFQLLQQSARLPEAARHEAGQELETDDVQELWEALARSPTTLHNFAPKRCLLLLLSQVLSAEEDVPYASLLERTRSFRGMVVMRPDGYLANALTGEPLQRFGLMELRDGRLMFHRFEVGGIYLNRMGVFFPVDDSLRQASIIPLSELALERDWLNLALDGAEDALAEMVLGLAHFFTDPVRTLEGLAQLPSAVASLIASSPEYFARYSTRPLQEQIREAARLSTHLITLYGSAAGTATRVSSTGPRLPVLSLSADGALAIEQVAVPVGTPAAVLGTSASAVYVLSGSRTHPEQPEVTQRVTAEDIKGARPYGNDGRPGHPFAHGVSPEDIADIINDPETTVFRGTNENGRPIDYYHRDGTTVITEQGDATRVITAYGRLSTRSNGGRKVERGMESQPIRCPPAGPMRNCVESLLTERRCSDDEDFRRLVGSRRMDPILIGVPWLSAAARRRKRDH